MITVLRLVTSASFVSVVWSLDVFMVDVLSCVFFDDVLCSFRKSKKFVVMGRCFKCSHYLRFLRVMADEDEKVMDEIDRIRRGESW